MKTKKQDNLTGKVLSAEKLKDLEFKERNNLENYDLYWYVRDGEELLLKRLLAHRNAYQVLNHYGLGENEDT
ncbi:hypothetical protein LCGC14_1011870 [marine sediment metagenome]|uniref:Uncharacterized protein n=1 Tax=marine sediment metagenome TaxID=412755 RepID=A0A0F9QIA8_9ZZZZ